MLAYNKAPHETPKKSPYEAFFGFKMRGAYDTPDETIQVSTMPEEDNETTGTDVYVLIEGEEEEEDTPHETDIPAETITNETVTEAGEDQNTRNNHERNGYGSRRGPEYANHGGNTRE